MYRMREQNMMPVEQFAAQGKVAIDDVMQKQLFLDDVNTLLINAALQYGCRQLLQCSQSSSMQPSPPVLGSPNERNCSMSKVSPDNDLPPQDRFRAGYKRV